MVVKRASFCLAVVQRQESCVAGSSYVSLTDLGKSTAGKGPGKKQKGSATPGASGANYGSTTLLRQPSHVDLSKCFGKSSYFSDINPRSMKRLMNILAVTGWLANQLLCVSVCLSVCLFVCPGSHLVSLLYIYHQNATLTRCFNRQKQTDMFLATT